MQPPLATNAWLALVLIAACAIASRAHGAPVGDGLDLTIPLPPTPVRVEGHGQLDYEVLLANHSDKRITLEEFVVRDGRDGRLIAKLSGKTLDQHIARFGAVPAPASDPESSLPVAGTLIEPGQQVVLFIDVSLPGHQGIDTLRHRVGYRVAGANGTFRSSGAPLALPRTRPSLLAPPLRGGPWAAFHDADWPRGHRRVFYRVDGHARLPGRFAIDWVKLDEHGRFATGDADLAQAWYGHGADVLAVADARVAAVRDGMGEPSRISQRTHHAPEDDAGNYVALQLADGRYAFYEHLRKGSIRVAVGERVRTGQVIAALGFSGESTGPHLHFHVADASSPLGGEGLPFEIRRFERLGRYDDIARLGKPWRPADGDIVRHHEWPGSNTVVRFADDPAPDSGR
ncbi:M23 family metallopeptidase [Rhodanobacter sp. FDAARGOS 1247]|uniref:M23 family metallopeptidase n=1 Tax=Rhodanobacter sp. FDAARGOS 1247 TaxID=2778082 RepID=UPI0019505ED9|nr:M23 family metallopeptidase [Rhodanobacter sp. FDAARGOS 1247]QRP63982.1 M23 family metallopeptidase [Rhodanobacter sp. FDAARGOS 1247]